MTQEEIETILDKELDSRQDQIENIPDAAKLILASHLRSKIELINETLEYQVQRITMGDFLRKKKIELEDELTKLNQ